MSDTVCPGDFDCDISLALSMANLIVMVVAPVCGYSTHLSC